MTHEVITEALASIGILHAEHYVICGDSYFTLGSAKGFTQRLLQPNLAEKFFKSIPDETSECKSDMSNDLGYNKRNFEYFSSLISTIEGKRAEEVAHRLLSKFMTIENVLCASEHEIVTEFSEKIAFFIKTLAYVSSRRVTDKLGFGSLHTKAAIAEYLKALFVGDSVEKLYLLTFDERGRFTACELLCEGTVNSSEVAPRKALTVAIEKGAHSVAIAHNHPLGRAKASIEDMKFTSSFTGIFATCDIKLVAHYIIAGQLCDIMSVGAVKKQQ